MHAGNRADKSSEELYGEDSDIEYDAVMSNKDRLKTTIKRVAPESAKRIYRKMRNRG
ncbi:hypothetical protein D3C86_2243540 [compost metagenome]